MEIGNRSTPVGVNFRHVLPLSIGSCKRVEQTFLWIIDLGNSQNIIDIGDDRETLRWNQICRRISSRGPICVYVERLNRTSRIACNKVAAIRSSRVCEDDKGVEITFVSRYIGQLNALSSSFLQNI